MSRSRPQVPPNHRLITPFPRLRRPRLRRQHGHRGGHHGGTAGAALPRCLQQRLGHRLTEPPAGSRLAGAKVVTRGTSLWGGFWVGGTTQLRNLELSSCSMSTLSGSLFQRLSSKIIAWRSNRPCLTGLATRDEQSL